MSPAYQRLLAEGVANEYHSLVEVDGLMTRPEKLSESVYPGAIVRISRHLYVDGKSITVGAPDWSKLFPA